METENVKESNIFEELFELDEEQIHDDNEQKDLQKDRRELLREWLSNLGKRHQEFMQYQREVENEHIDVDKELFKFDKRVNDIQKDMDSFMNLYDTVDDNPRDELRMIYTRIGLSEDLIRIFDKHYKNVLVFYNLQYQAKKMKIDLDANEQIEDKKRYIKKLNDDCDAKVNGFLMQQESTLNDEQQKYNNDISRLTREKVIIKRSEYDRFKNARNQEVDFNQVILKIIELYEGFVGYFPELIEFEKTNFSVNVGMFYKEAEKELSTDRKSVV